MEIFKNIFKSLVTLIFLVFVIFSFIKIQAHDCLSMNEAKSILEGSPKSIITVLDEDISMEEAYCTQEKVNYLIKKEYNDKIGYKVGFTGKATQKIFNISEPATGVLYEHMFIRNNGTLNKNFGHRTLIEPDLMVIVKNEDIMKAKNNLEILRNLESLHPFIEIPAVRFNKNVKVNGKMLIAANMLATKMVMGDGIKIEATEAFLTKLENMDAIFSDQENNIIQKASTGNLMGNPINVVAWLINDFSKKGIILKEGDRLSLGSVGKLFPLKENTKYIYTLEDTKDKVSLSININ